MSAFIEYLEQHYSLKPTSNQLQVIGPCPFCGHDSLDQRMYVNPKTDGGFCHHCGKGFNQITFVAAREGCDNKTARKILRKEASGFVRSGDEDEQEVIPEVPWPEMVDVFDFSEAQDYLNARNVSDDMIRQFRLKYCVKNMAYNDKLYRTQGRVIIPIYSTDGKAVGWQGRDITGVFAG